VGGRTWWARLWGGAGKRGPDGDAEANSDDDLPSDRDADADSVTVITGEELDLHTFAPRQVADVVAEYVDWAAEQGLRSVRIIHGKGTGTLRRIVHSTLQKHPRVERFELAGERSGSWGATVAVLRAPGKADEPTNPPAKAGRPGPDEPR
jgi:hypothetical protein